MGRYEARATVDWSGFGGTVESASGLLSTATAAQIELGGPGGATNPEELFAAAHATEHCPVCQAIRGNVAMGVTAAFDAPAQTG